MRPWRAVGRIFPPAGAALPSWVGGYGALPCAVPGGDGRARVFFSGRDSAGRSHVGACTLDLSTLAVIPGSLTQEPLVSPGPPGAFDESGCTMSSLVVAGGRWYLYYTGWTLGRTVPFYMAIGLALSDDGGRTFRKHSLAPLLDRHDVDPFLCASPWVIKEAARWRMWYISGVRWTPGPLGPRHFYLVKYAESDDGLLWKRDGKVSIDFASEDEHAIGRPCVVREAGLYRMWYCYRGAAYRIGYAESPDGLDWKRHDEEAGAPPPQDWDAEMQAYPMVYEHGGRRILLYNGNGYGATGFGAAVEEAAVTGVERP